MHASGAGSGSKDLLRGPVRLTRSPHFRQLASESNRDHGFSHRDRGLSGPVRGSRLRLSVRQPAVGRFLRPQDPNVEKLEVYECGEPTIGSSFVQFDLRFYVVALLFIIFDVEVAFFFPWATVFGKATHLMDPNLAKVTADGGS